MLLKAHSFCSLLLQIMPADKFPSTFSRQFEAIVYISIVSVSSNTTELNNPVTVPISTRLFSRIKSKDRIKTMRFFRCALALELHALFYAQKMNHRNKKNPPVLCRIIMKNFLRIRDGDRFWYERYLSQEVTMKLFIPYYFATHIHTTCRTIKCRFKYLLWRVVGCIFEMP